MYRKNCNRCNRPSYSSSEMGEWVCPVCGNDLTKAPFFYANTLEKAMVKPTWKKDLYRNHGSRPVSKLFGGET